MHDGLEGMKVKLRFSALGSFKQCQCVQQSHPSGPHPHYYVIVMGLCPASTCHRLPGSSATGVGWVRGWGPGPAASTPPAIWRNSGGGGVYNTYDSKKNDRWVALITMSHAKWENFCSALPPKMGAAAALTVQNPWRGRLPLLWGCTIHKDALQRPKRERLPSARSASK